MVTESMLVAAYRLLNPRSRIVSIFKLHKNTSSTKQKICVVCGAVGPTWCARYPQTVTAYRWEHNHRSNHVKVA
jgi:hypothetical protein